MRSRFILFGGRREVRHSNKRVRAFEKGNLSHTMFFEAFEKEIQLSNNFIRAFEKETLFVVSTRHCFFQKLHQHKLGAARGKVPKFGAWRCGDGGLRLRDREEAHVIVKSSGKRNWRVFIYLPRAPGQLPIAHAWRCGDAAASRVVE